MVKKNFVKKVYTMVLEANEFDDPEKLSLCYPPENCALLGSNARITGTIMKFKKIYPLKTTVNDKLMLEIGTTVSAAMDFADCN